MTTFKFYSTTWCPSCKVMKPWMAELAPKTEFILLDDVPVDELMSLNIASVPVVVKRVDGLEVGRLVGGVSKATMAKFVKGD